MHNFATQQGRLGQRHGARFWEQQSTIGQNRELLIVICQKWPVAQRLVSRVNARTDINALAYLFSEDTVILPNLGGIQASLSQRNRHRKALLRLVFDSNDDDRLLIYLDLAVIDFIKDFCAESPSARLLEIDCDLTDYYLTNHAIALGLITSQSSQAARRKLLPSLRDKILLDQAQLNEASFDTHYRIAEQGNINDTASVLAQFLALPEQGLCAEKLAKNLFSNEDADAL